MNIIEEIKNKFSRITKLQTGIYNDENRLTHNLSGTVLIEASHANEIIFNENLRWENRNSLLLNSRNVYRWKFTDSGNIKLDHLRFGKDKPVFLVEFTQTGKDNWTGIEPHDCNKDLYSAKLNIENNNIILHWTVSGPTENYTLKTVYS